MRGRRCPIIFGALAAVSLTLWAVWMRAGHSASWDRAVVSDDGRVLELRYLGSPVDSRQLIDGS